MMTSSRENFSSQTSSCSDAILISNLELGLRIGTTSLERAAPQKIELDLELSIDLQPAGKSNDLSATIDYSLVARQLEEHLESREWVLLENLADAICMLLFEAYPTLNAIGLEIRKFVIPRTASVGVRVWRHR